MKTKIYPIFLIFVFSIIFFVFYKGLKNSNIYTPNVKSQINIPKFQAKDFENNKTINSKDIFLNDKFYLLNIWASWCAPCRLEHQYLMELSKENKIDIVGINYKDQSDNAKKFILDYGNPYSRILIDLDGTKSIQLGAFGVPETYVINNFDKKIIKKYVGPIDEKKFKQILKIIK